MHNKFFIPKEYLRGKREGYLSWDETFMLHAVVTSARSKDPSSQVGAVLVGKNNRILSLRI
jgi:dCMP deaminase